MSRTFDTVTGFFVVVAECTTLISGEGYIEFMAEWTRI